MSEFEFEELKSRSESRSESILKSVLVRPNDPKWKSFPPCALAKFHLQVLNHSLSKIKNFHVYDDDIFLTGYPRSGTTLVTEMIWLIANHFDFDKARSVITDDRVPGLEFNDVYQAIRTGKVTDAFENLQRPRTIRTHLPVQLLPEEVWVKKPKMIYCSRDPRDVAISSFHFATHYESMKMCDFLDVFMSKDCIFGPYREHCLNYWNIPDYPNILYLTYESVTSNMDEAIRKVASFLEVSVSDENVDKLKDHLKFDKMKTNPSCNNKLFFEKLNEFKNTTNPTDDFIRRGKIGGYKDEMPEEYIEKFEKWIAEQETLEAGFPRIRK